VNSPATKQSSSTRDARRITESRDARPPETEAEGAEPKGTQARFYASNQTEV
jgi:hypothetical protein